MSIYKVQPISDFTMFATPPDQRKGIQFKADWVTTSKELARELEALVATDAVLEIAVKPSHVRKDGQLRSDVPKDLPHPGVRLSFQTRAHGQMSFSCDTYAARYFGQMADWQANLRAIVLTLESLRAVDRYGATQGEQYAGFKALGAGTGGIALGGMTKTEAESVLSEIVGAFDRSEGAERHRRARAMSHPDRHGGDQTLWDRVEAAALVLGLSS